MRKDFLLITLYAGQGCNSKTERNYVILHNIVICTHSGKNSIIVNIIY